MHESSSHHSLRNEEKRVLLGITGGIAAYKVAELAHTLSQSAVTVQTVMTRSACQFITPLTFQSLTGNPVHTELWESNASGSMTHINLSREVDVIMVAPASADFIAKLAHGIADDLLSTLCLARNCPLMIAPAMNRQMWENPATQRNLAMLRSDGIRIVGPANGIQACGEVGMGRMVEPTELAEAIITFWQNKHLLINKKIVITAGPTFEAIDPVRGLTNKSSGKMGYAIAQAAVEAGANVTLVSGPTDLTPPAVDKFVAVISANEMLTAVQYEIPSTDVFIGVAAVADYRVATMSAQKIKKTNHNLTLELTPNPDILMTIATASDPPFCVGFAAETENLLENAQAKRIKKRLPLMVANWAQNAIGSDDNELILLDDQGEHILPRAPKLEQARHLIQHISTFFKP
ncbi:phosphopantothenate-cysteine ligase /Phosphopantothenoylcysteine decarboxylase [Nitrosomonas sp. PY1]|uniref:bifunctional phosphopantothenoylcysteine decarboxylase/phosphopantothenate--cysteine ligase CoaBC n=1 Tax=Nitrosomonas sp. PY1 TaxID=1803906 RepID=UPI001FC8C129|nr:bifunctional phosphopantothenoylcysteine decarboxylase/phosphopantothenate--cysteine ligase CoaBC [Nitrosomonas sp. PY1]GKS70326.1 phosphopantothenate-cysteine ligase /Phosphopantothenoylcysteine decarboxylase [Nitrosomonas sp. PY1]